MPTRDTLLALRERVLAATGADREIDDAIAETLDDIAGWHIPQYTDSVDAAVRLIERVLPDWNWLVRNKSDQAFFANLHAPNTSPNEGDPCWPEHAATAPLAMLASLFTALASPGAANVE